MPLSRKERERKRRQRDVMEVAERVFAEYGFHDASMEKIAAAAEYASSALYRYFESKEDLYVAVLLAKMEQWYDCLKAAAATVSDPVEALESGIRAGVNFTHSNREFLRIYCYERSKSPRPDKLWLQIDDLIGEVIGWNARYIAAGQKKGRFRAGDARAYALALDGVMSSLLFQWLQSEANKPAKEVADFIVNFVMNGLKKTPDTGSRARK